MTNEPEFPITYKDIIDELPQSKSDVANGLSKLVDHEKIQDIINLTHPQKQYAEMIDLDELPILHLTHPKLMARPDPFDFDATPQIDPIELSKRMFKKMRDMGGIGLSANQLGLNYRMFVFGDEKHQFNVFNPHLVSVSDEMWLFEEACLSFPGFSLTLSRPKAITVSYQTELAETKVQTLSGLAGRVFLHEYDHMEGINFMMYASKFKLDWELKKWKKHNQRQRRNK